MIFKRLSIVGLGVIGGSLAKAITNKKLAENIIAYDNNSKSLKYALNNKIITKIASGFKQLCEDSDCIIICVPPRSFKTILENLLPYIEETTIIMDVSSVKKSIVEIAKTTLPNKLLSLFVPAHPIAGSEKNGILASNVNLFNNKKAFITPIESTSPEAIKIITNLWEAIGSQVFVTKPEEHDKIYAEFSHTPQLIAFAIMKVLENLELDAFEMLKANIDEQFKKFIRIAASEVSMWVDIFIENKKFILESLKSIDKNIKNLIVDLEKNIHSLKINLVLVSKNWNDNFSSFEVESKSMLPNLQGDMQEEVAIIIRKFPAIISYIVFESCSYNCSYAGAGFRDLTYPLKTLGEKFDNLSSSELSIIKDILNDFCLTIAFFENLLEENNIQKLKSEINNCKEVYNKIVPIVGRSVKQDISTLSTL